jgi:hypothetical protein
MTLTKYSDFQEIFKDCLCYFPVVANGTSYLEAMNGYNGVIHGSVPLNVIDRFGWKYTPNWESQSTSNYITVALTDKMSATSQTIIAAIRPRALASNHPTALSLHDGVGSAYGWDLTVGSDQFNIMLNTSAGDNLKQLIYTGSNPDWEIYAISFSPTSMKLYKNGNLIASNTTAGTYVYTSTMNLNIGIDTPGTYYPFMGEIGEILLFTTELTDLQVQTIYKIMATGYPQVLLSGGERGVY